MTNLILSRDLGEFDLLILLCSPVVEAVDFLGCAGFDKAAFFEPS